MKPWLCLTIVGKHLVKNTYNHSSSTRPLVSIFGLRRLSTNSGNVNEYEKIKEECKSLLKVPEHFNFAKDIVEKWAKAKPVKLALHITNGQDEFHATYSKLFDEATVLASALSDPAPPKCILVILPKIFEWWVFNVAASWCDSIISPATTLLTANDVAHRLSECSADCIVCDTATAEKIDGATKGILRKIVVANERDSIPSDWIRYDELIKTGKARGVSPCVKTKSDDIAQIFFTSGTTGKPKMVPHTQGGYGIYHLSTAKFWLDLREEDMVWNLSDTGWAKAAWSSLYVPMLEGASIFVHQMKSFDANEVLRSLTEHPISIMCAPPTAYRALVQCDMKKYKFQSLRRCVSAGEPLNPEVIQKWKQDTGLHIYEGYGQSETTLLCGTGVGVDIRPGSMGKPAPGYNLKIIDANQQELQSNEEGYLAVSLMDGHPMGLFKGYINNEKQTSEVFVGNYYLTGDRAYRDDDGYLWFVGRSDDVIISAGYRIGPFEVESALLEHPAVVESAVVSSPDELRGEVVKAFVVLTNDYKNRNSDSLIKELQDHVKQTTAPYKYPRKIEFVDSLPKNISGKIRRVVLRKQEWEKS